MVSVGANSTLQRDLLFVFRIITFLLCKISLSNSPRGVCTPEVALEVAKAYLDITRARFNKQSTFPTG